ncbi:MAG: NHL repeat-containing protein [Candidatus Eremiobacteraeota bacterium]|nr:NHL repeat-containing protein [Candidatus Eremiobacteraeota bacterium]MBV9737573.1 NHL repeat-containing protein [Candidatus Eremiobacteraeota bacterium]
MLRRFVALPLGLLAGVALASCSSSTAAISIGPNFNTLSLYVTNSTQNAISIYPPNPNSGTAPINQIGGSSTQLNGPQYDTFDPSKRLYVSNYNAGTTIGSITVYASQATGNVLPVAAISGSATTIGSARGIAVDLAGNIYLANVSNPPFFTSSILIFPPGSTGNTAPGAISGTLTGLNGPVGLAVDPSARVYAANAGAGTIGIFSPNSSGNVAPLITIGGPMTTLNTPTGLSLDPAGNIYVTDVATSKILIFAASVVTSKNGNVPPMMTIGGNLTQLSNPTDVKVDSANRIYVCNGNGKILVFPPATSGNLNIAPSAVITPPGNVIGLAFSP